MTAPYGQQPLLDHRWMPFVSSVEIPAFAVMQADGATWGKGQIILKVQKPDSPDPEDVFYLNGPTPIAELPEGASELRGACVTAIETPFWALYYDRDTTPQAGETWGPIDGEWYLRRNEPGFKVIDVDSDNTRILVLRDNRPYQRYFELYDPLTPGGVAQAHPRSGVGGDYTTDKTADTFEVVDVLARFRGRGSRGDGSPGPHPHGSYGLARKRNGQWEIEDLQPHATQIQGDVHESGGFAETDATFKIDQIEVMQPVSTALLLEPLENGEDITIHNIHEWDGEDNATLQAAWNDHETKERWEDLQKDC